MTGAEIISGGLAFIVTIYSYMKYKGLKILPKEVEGALDELTKTNAGLTQDFRTLENQVYQAVGNISLSEIQAIIKKAQELNQNGATPEGVQELGQMVLDAAKS